MGRRLRPEEVVTIKVLARKGLSNRAIARQVGVTEGAVRYQLSKASAPDGGPDGRTNKPLLADRFEAPMRAWIASQRSGRPVNCAALFEHLVEEHEYPHDYRTVLRWVRRHFPKPRIRTWRRVETPPGAQAQTDWGEFPRVRVGSEEEHLHLFVMVLGYSRMVAVVWSRREDQLSWLACHNAAFRRLGGIPAVNRIDNVKTAVVRGAGSWGTLNATYRSYARSVGFHIDACQPRQANAKGKVEAKVRLSRLRFGPGNRTWLGLEELQQHSDERIDRWSRTAVCPVTGESVYDTWRCELASLRSLPTLPEPFDVSVLRPVRPDCLVHFEGRQYAVPFRFVGRQVEVRGCVDSVQVIADGDVVQQYPRGGARRLHIDPRCYEGDATDRVLPPPPLGAMGQQLQAIVQMPVEQRPVDLYAALAEVAR